MRLLVCGDRHWTDRKALFNTLYRICNPTNDLLPPEPSVLIHGGCGHFDAETRILYGADRIADEWAIVNWIPVEEHLPDWDRYGHAAGPRRNQEMLDQGKPDLVIAFHADIEQSKGTKDMVARARRAGIEVRIVTGKEDQDEYRDNR